MAEGEITVDNSPEQAPRKSTLIEEVRAEALKKEAQKEEMEDQKIRENIAENAQNFWRFFKMIPEEDYPRLDTPEKLVEALNQKGGSFIKTGEDVQLNNADYRICEISPCGILENSEKLEEMISLCDTGKYSMLTGTNFWDNPPQEGRLFIPAIYLAERKN